MKEFEKWLDETAPGIRAIDWTYEEEDAAEEAWKAALETVNSKLWLADGQVVNEVKAWIIKELNE